jgi:hypothetical protein
MPLLVTRDPSTPVHAMKTTPPRTLMFQMASLLLLALGAAGRVQDTDRRNAATWYLQAVERYQALPQDVRDALANYDSSHPPTAAERAAVEQARPILDLARRGAQQGFNDMALDYAAGPDLMLPHLGQMRQLARAMRTDAYVRFADGDSTAAAQIVGDMYRMSEHASEDSVLISSLVGMAVFRLSDDITQFGIDRGMFSPTDSAILLEAADQLDASNPFHIMDSIESENTNFIGWFVEKYSGEGGLDAAVTELPQWLGVSEAHLAVLAAEMGDQYVLDADLQKLQQCMDFVEETVFTADSFEQAQQELKEWEKQLEAGEYGVLARMLVPSFDRALASAITTQDQIAQRRVMLRKLARGEISPLDAANAATWYLRAIETLDALPREELRTLHARQDERDAGATNVASQHAALLEHAQPIIETLAQAAAIERCQFASVVSSQRSPAIAKSWLPGMRELARLLRDDAARLRKAGQHDQAADRLRLALRMSAHLSQGKTIAESVTAHVILNEAAAPLESLHATGKVSDEMTAKVGAAASKLSSRDALGYNAAVTADRDAFARAVTVGGRSGDLPIVESFKRENLDALTADQVAYAVAVWDRATSMALERVKVQQAAAVQSVTPQIGAAPQPPVAPPAPSPAPPPDVEVTLPEFDPMHRLDDVMDRAALELTWQASENVLEAVKRGEVPSGSDLPNILDAASRSRRAAADVQGLLTALGLPQPR